MSLPLDAYRAKLVVKILYARTEDDVERYIDTAIRALEDRKVNGHIIARFVDKIINQFEISNLSAPSEQTANINAAKVYLNRIKKGVAAPVG